MGRPTRLDANHRKQVKAWKQSAHTLVNMSLFTGWFVCVCVCTPLLGFLAGDQAEEEFLLIYCVSFLRVSPRVCLCVSLFPLSPDPKSGLCTTSVKIIRVVPSVLLQVYIVKCREEPSLWFVTAAEMKTAEDGS